jgi:hypothetical protein
MSPSRYASLLFGTTKYKEIGPFRLAVYGELTPGEAKELAELTRSQSMGSFKSLKLARKLAKDRNISTKAAIALLGNLDDDANEDILYDYAGDLAEAQENQITEEAADILYATAAIKYRGEIAIEGTWTPVRDWTEADTNAIPSFALVKEIATFLRTERGDAPKSEGNAKEPGKSPTTTPST